MQQCQTKHKTKRTNENLVRFLKCKTIVEIIKKKCLSKKKQKLRNTIIDAFEEASEEIMNHKDGSLSTCIVAEIHSTWVRFYHAGDSMAMLSNPAGEVTYYTVSHSPLAYGLELGIKRKDLQHIKNLVNNVVGSADLRVEVSSKIPVEKNDFLLLMSDGVSDNYEMAELCQSVLQDNNIAKVLESVKQETSQRMLSVNERGFGGPDDQTAIFYQFL